MVIKAKKVKYDSRTRKKLKIRRRILGTGERPRISVFKSSKHTYAQIISDLTGVTLVSASTLDKEVSDQIPAISSKQNAAKEKSGGEKSTEKGERAASAKSNKSVLAARAVGIVLAKRCLDKNISKVVFDRNGFIYKGRIQAIAEGAREGGLEF